MEMSRDSENIVSNYFKSPAVAFMLMSIGVPAVFALVIGAIKRH
jgi:hypothetical protein